jgi:hypothetical protein
VTLVVVFEAAVGPHPEQPVVVPVAVTDDEAAGDRAAERAAASSRIQPTVGPSISSLYCAEFML